MKALVYTLVYKGPRDVRVEKVPDPRIEQPTDVIVKITTTNICGSDLHMYEGRTDVEEGKILGHEVSVKSSKSANQFRASRREI